MLLDYISDFPFSDVKTSLETDLSFNLNVFVYTH